MARPAAVAISVACASAAIALFAGDSFATEAHPTASAPLPALSKSGQILWQFEALLHDTFGNRPVCASGRWAQEFTSGDCSPLAVYSPYSYVFAHAHRSAFHISSKKRVGGFGNYPIAVLIRGRPIACNARETQFLIKYRDSASLTLGCSRAGYVIP
jgi:hypothetical protein